MNTTTKQFKAFYELSEIIFQRKCEINTEDNNLGVKFSYAARTRNDDNSISISYQIYLDRNISLPDVWVVDSSKINEIDILPIINKAYQHSLYDIKSIMRHKYQVPLNISKNQQYEINEFQIVNRVKIYDSEFKSDVYKTTFDTFKFESDDLIS